MDFEALVKLLYSDILKEAGVENEKDIKRHSGSIDTKSVDKKNRTIKFLSSVEVKDRHGDVVLINGLSLKTFEKNPVVLFGHDYKSFPIGRVISSEIVSVPVDGRDVKALEQTVEFMPADISEEADKIFKMCAAGYLNAVSIGFIAKKGFWNDDEKAYFFEESEMIELSVVPVPANQEALMRDFSDNYMKDVEEDQVDDEIEEVIEEVQDEFEEHNKTMIKQYRKFMVKLRGLLNYDATEDEEADAKEIFTRSIALLSMIKDQLKDIATETQGDEDEDTDTEPAETQEAGVDKAISSMLAELNA